MFELSRCLWATMVNVQCKSPYSENNECLCPDRFSFSLFKFLYYWRLKKLKGVVKELGLNLKYGCIEVILQDEYPVCANSNETSGTLGLIDFRVSDLHKGIEEYAKLSINEQRFFVRKLPIILTLRLQYQSGSILYEDVESFENSSFRFLRLAIIAWDILERISKNRSCDRDILILIKMMKKKSMVEKAWEKIAGQSNYYRRRLLIELQRKQVVSLPLVMAPIDEIEDLIDLPQKYTQDTLSLLMEFLKRYCDGKEVKHEIITEFKSQYASVAIKNELIGIKEKDIIVLKESILVRINRIYFSQDVKIGNEKYLLFSDLD